MSRWTVIYIFLILILSAVNQFRAANDDNHDTKTVIAEGEGKSKESVSSSQNGIVQIGSNSPCQDLPHSQQTSFKRQQLPREHLGRHDGNRSVAMQVVYATQQGEGITMWTMRLSVAPLFGPLLCAWRENIKGERLDLCGLERGREQSKGKEAFSISPQLTEGADTEVEKDQEESAERSTDASTGPAVEQQGLQCESSSAFTDHTSTCRSSDGGQVQSFASSLGEAGKFGRSSVDCGGGHSQSGFFKANACSSQEARSGSHQVSRGAEGKAKPSRLLVEVLGGVDQAMDIFRGGLWQERQRAGGQSYPGEREAAGSKVASRRDEGAVVQKRRGLCQRHRADRLRDGRGQQQGGDIRTHTGRNHSDGSEPGSSSSTATRRCNRAYSQKAKNIRQGGWRRCIWALCAWGQNVTAFCGGGQVDHTETCHTPKDILCFQDPCPERVAIWNHSIVKKNIFVPEWKASFTALDLAFELGHTRIEGPRIFAATSKSRRFCRLRFCTAVDLYVGPEDDDSMQMWQHSIGTSHKKASIFHNEWESDQTSFMAQHVPGHPPVHERIEEPQLMDQHGPVQQEDDGFVEVLVDAASEHEESEASWDSVEPVRSNWKTVLIFALHRTSSTLRLDWYDWDLVHDSIARELSLFPADLYHVHPVRHPPEDLFQAFVEPVVVQRATDLSPGSPERIVLVDVEFHSSRVATVPEVVRQARAIFNPLTRTQILHHLGLKPYCRHVADQCIIWKNNDMVPHKEVHLDFAHGDYLRIAIPPLGDNMDYISTRCLATAFHRGMSLQDVFDRHTLYVLGWHDYVIDPPWLPASQTNYEDEGVLLMQRAMHRMPMLPVPPKCLQDHFKPVIGQDTLTCLNDRLEDEAVDYEPFVYQQQGEEQEPIALAPGGILDQPATIQELYGIWTAHTVHTPPEVPEQLVIATWYLDLFRHESCLQSREVRLSRDFLQWTQQIFEAWQDHVDLAWPLNLYLVRPPPPVTRHRGREVIHVIVVQRSMADRMANLITIVDPGIHEGFTDIATFAPAQIIKDDVIAAVHYDSKCHPERSHLQCMTWHGDFELRGRVALRNRHGLAFVLIYNNIFDQPPTNLMWETEEIDESPFLQTRTELKLDELIPATTAVRLLSTVGPGVLPSPLEVELPGTAEQVERELLRWGHVCQAFSCAPHNAFLCVHAVMPSTQDHMHYLMCHDDPMDHDGCILHSSPHDLSHGQLMSFLCSIGYPRAVILEVIDLNTTWRKVSFHHSEPEVEIKHVGTRQRTEWPERMGHQRTQQKLTEVASHEELSARCALTTSFNKKDLEELFVSGFEVLCTDFSVLDLTPELRLELSQWQIKQVSQASDLDEFDRLLIFTDGSSRPSMRRVVPERADDLGHSDTWAMVVIGETFNHMNPTDSSIKILGWTSHPVRHDPNGRAYMGTSRMGSDIAERAGLIGAAMWRLSINHAIPTIVRTDSMLGAGQARGTTGVTQPDDSYHFLRALYQALECALPQGDFLVQHVRAHTGDLFNEIVDTAAKQEAAKSFNLPRQKLDLRVWREKFLQLWTLFGHRRGLPHWRDGGFDVCAPDLPPRSTAKRDKATLAKSSGTDMSVVWFQCSVATMNVQSLYRGPCGHAGKLHYLQAQMRFFQLHIMAIQEARSEEAMTQNDNILRISTGCIDSIYGVELWVDLKQPIGYENGSKSPLTFHKDHFVVTHRDPQRLLVRCATKYFSFWIFCGHAPHGGHAAHKRHQWWETTQQILNQFVDTKNLIVLMDANAAPGARDDVVVFSEGFSSSVNTSDFRDLLTTWDLYLPATSHVHVGTNDTWQSLDGNTQHCIDHIAIPQSWWQCCTHSQVLTEFDLATAHDDHQVVALQLQWAETALSAKQHNDDDSLAKPCAYAADPSYDAVIKAITAQPWQVDVETQALDFTVHLRGILQQTKNQVRSSPKKPYIDAETWATRASKLALRKQLRQTRRALHRQALVRSLYAWRACTKDSDEQEIFHCSYNYVTTLHCCSIRLYAQYRRVSRVLKRHIATSKSRALQCTMDSIQEDTPAAVILRKLRAFVGPSNPKKYKYKPLPMIMKEDGTTCTHMHEITEAWVKFFQTMECGQTMSKDMLREVWINELEAFAQQDLHKELKEMPTLTDLELALRRVPCGRSCGPDGIPGEVCRHHSAAVAMHLYPQLLKLLLHGQEHIGFKGGKLTPAYKGRGATNRCASYRSLLVSNHLGKALHRTIREHHSAVYHQFLQLQQTGGRKHVPVQLAMHQLRAFVRVAKSDNHSTGILYLDLTEAFYRVLREIPLGGEIPDHVLAHVVHRLHLPADSLHRLHAMLAQPCALTQAGIPESDRRAIQAIHTSTHFWVNGQTTVSRTAMGTRPGDSMADWVFAFTWSIVLDKVEQFMRDRQILRTYQEHEFLPLFGRVATTDVHFPFIGPNWMDDLALCVQSPTPTKLVSDIGAVAGFLLDTCHEHCLTPNLSAGKTEIQLSFRGRESRKQKTNFYGPQAPQTMHVVGEEKTHNIRVVRRYRHLGGISHHTGEQIAELSQRAAMGHQALNQHRKMLFQNDRIALGKRAELFTMLVLSKCFYGADSWVFTNQKTERRFHTMIMNLYKRLAKVRPDQHLTDDEILVRVALPCPAVLLARARLRYFATLVHTGLPDIWALFAGDTAWIALLEKDLIWMWTQLQHASALPDPSTHFEQWLYLIQTSPRYWKRLVRRACHHSVLQRQRRHQVCALHLRVMPRLWTLVDRQEANQQIPDQAFSQVFGCMKCRMRCRNAAGEAAHMCKAHGITSKLRSLFDHPTCGACLKHFHTMEKLKAHLHYSQRCRTKLQSRAFRCAPAPGAGSAWDAQRVQQHDRLLPPIQSQGPHERPGRLRQELDIDGEWHQFMVDLICEETDVMDIKAKFLDHLNVRAISWTSLQRTLRFFIDTLSEDDADVIGFDLMEMRALFEALGRPDQWDFLQMQSIKQEEITIDTLAAECEDLTDHLLQQTVEIVPRVFGKHRVLLHAFSGRRRLGDLQYYMEQHAQQQEVYILHIVSMDIIVDKVKGNAMDQKTWDFWVDATRQKHVIAFLAGPPCETRSCARAVAVDSAPDFTQPRVIRTMEHLWGLPCVSIKELLQLFTGNTLLGFALVMFVEICMSNGFAILEHPSESPWDEQAASIWKLPLIAALLALPNVQKISFSQGLLGAFARKPTNLLVVNLPQLMLDLHACRVRTEIPQAAAIGKNADGSWKTTRLKEYPPALCWGMAMSFARGLAQTSCDPSVPEPTQEQLALYVAMDVKTYGSTLGADFAGAL